MNERSTPFLCIRGEMREREREKIEHERGIKILIFFMFNVSLVCSIKKGQCFYVWKLRDSFVCRHTHTHKHHKFISYVVVHVVFLLFYRFYFEIYVSCF